MFKSDNNKIDEIYYKRCKYNIEKLRKLKNIPQIDSNTGRKI